MGWALGMGWPWVKHGLRMGCHGLGMGMGWAGGGREPCDSGHMTDFARHSFQSWRTARHVLGRTPIKRNTTHSGAIDACWQVVPMAGVGVSNVDMTDLAAVKAAIVPGKTKLVRPDLQHFP